MPLVDGEEDEETEDSDNDTFRRTKQTLDKPTNTFLTRMSKMKGRESDESLNFFSLAAPYRRAAPLMNRCHSPDSILSGMYRE